MKLENSKTGSWASIAAVMSFADSAECCSLVVKTETGSSSAAKQITRIQVNRIT